MSLLVGSWPKGVCLRQRMSSEELPGSTKQARTCRRTCHNCSQSLTRYELNTYPPRVSSLALQGTNWTHTHHVSLAWIYKVRTEHSSTQSHKVILISLTRIYTLQCIWASGVLSSLAIYGMQRCACSNHPVDLRKGFGTCDGFLCVAHTLLRALKMGQLARIVQIDYSAVIDRVKHQGILFMLCSLGVGGSVLSVLTQFLSNRSQYVVVDGCRCKPVSVVSGAPQGSDLGLQLFLLYTAQLFSIVENKQAVRLCWRLMFGSCCAWGGGGKRGVAVKRVPESWSEQGSYVV